VSRASAAVVLGRARARKADAEQRLQSAYWHAGQQECLLAQAEDLNAEADKLLRKAEVRIGLTVDRVSDVRWSRDRTVVALRLCGCDDDLVIPMFRHADVDRLLRALALDGEARIAAVRELAVGK
jgi:hypothetical protein